MAERQLPKLDTRVRFSSPAPHLQSKIEVPRNLGVRPLAARLVLGFLVIVTAQAQAQRLDIELEAEIGTSRYSSLERSGTGVLLNQEAGSLPLQGLRARVKKGPWSLAINVNQRADTVEYLGVTQSGLPISTRTELGLVQQSLSINRHFALGPSQEFVARLGLRGLELDRQILPGVLNSALHEKLRSNFVGIGMGYRWGVPLSNNFAVQLGLDLDWQRSTRNSLSFDTFGKYDLATMVPDSFSLLELALGLRLEHSSGFYTGIRLASLSFSPSSSPSTILNQKGVPVALVTYPGSTQRVKTSAFLMGWRF